MVIINIRTNIQSPGLYARMIWQQLFKLSSAKDFKNLDSFLCDLKIIENMIIRSITNWWWYYDQSGQTEILEYDEPYRKRFHVTITQDEIRIDE